MSEKAPETVQDREHTGFITKWYKPIENTDTNEVRGEYAFVAKDTKSRIEDECDALKKLLLEKNRKYGDSALKPKGVFAKGSAEELIRTRIDDKLSRIANGLDDEEDTITDLCGYLILLKIARTQ